MIKLILHVLVACALWFLIQLAGFGVVPRLVGIVVGAVAVHFVWERLVFDPLRYLGAMPVSDDDPLMTSAKARAKETLPEFRALFPEHEQDSMVKFLFHADSGVKENLWADLLSLSGDSAKVYIRTAPVEHKGDLDRNQEIAVDDIVDWQVEMPDGTIRGGFTNFALFKIFEREEGYLHSKLRSQMQRFTDCQQANRGGNDKTGGTCRGAASRNRP